MEKNHVMNADNATIEQMVANAIKTMNLTNCTVTFNITNTAENDQSHGNIEQTHGPNEVKN